jgi:hypothetical protein
MARRRSSSSMRPGSADSKWRSYVGSHRQSASRRPRSGTVTSGVQATARLAGAGGARFDNDIRGV